MATTIKLKNGSGAPTAGQLVQGEPALDLTNKRLYTEDSGGTVIEVGVNPTSITTSTGTFSGEITANAGIALPDGQKATFGTSDDLQIYHDGSHSRIQDTGTGNLKLQGNNLDLVNGTGTAFYATFADAGAATLFYNGLSKLATTTTGIDVTGTVEADGLTVDGAEIVVGRNSVSNAGYTMEATSTNASCRNWDMRANHLAFGDLVFRQGASQGAAPSVIRQRIDVNGDISFYDTSGSSAKFFWDASAESLGIGTTTPARPLDVNGAIRLADASGIEWGGTAYSIVGDTAGAMTFKTASTERLRIDSAGNVGIGTSSPTAYTNFTTLAIGNATQGGVLELQYAGVQAGRIATTAANTMTFTTNNAERARIDSSGNLLVGATDGTGTTAGFKALSTGLTRAVRASDVALAVSRLTTDGDIAVFQKDGTSVGSIGSISGSILYAGSGDTNLAYNSSTDSIYPVTTGGSGVRDNAVNLGVTTSRFKDLYLSGGVYLGGTVAANHLNDYEEGTWTPTVTFGGTGVTVNVLASSNNYQKVGNTVILECSMTINRGTTIGNIKFAGFPFTMQPFTASVIMWGLTTPAGYDKGIVFNNAGDAYLIGDSGLVSLSSSHFPASTDVSCNIRFSHTTTA